MYEDDRGRLHQDDEEEFIEVLVDGRVYLYPKTDRDRRIDAEHTGDDRDDVLRFLGQGEDLATDDRFTAPLVLRDDGKPGCGMRMSHRDGAAYLSWVGGVLYGPASSNLDMN